MKILKRCPFFILLGGLGFPASALAQFSLIETGGTFRSDDTNYASQSQGGVAFATDLLNGDGYGVHTISGLNDGVYGNSSSWIGNSAGSAGVVFGSTQDLSSFAFGRDNTGGFADRNAGSYSFYYTTDSGLTTLNALDGSVTWTEIGSLTYSFGSPESPARRHLYNLDATLTGVTGFRIAAPNGNAIDEIELYASFAPPPPPPTITYAADETQAAGITTTGGVFAEVAAGTATQSGALSGTGLFTKTGAGTLILSSVNTDHTGGTVVSAGTLVSGAGNGSGTGSLTVNAGATLRSPDGLFLYADNLATGSDALIDAQAYLRLGTLGSTIGTESSLNMENGGRVVVGTQLEVASNTDTTVNILVDGEDSELLVGAGVSAAAGLRAESTLTISNGGNYAVTGTHDSGRGGSSTSTLLVTGTDSRFSTTGHAQFAQGVNATADITVSAGGTAHANGNLEIGAFNTDTTTTVLVTGAGSVLSTSLDVYLAKSAGSESTLTVTDGGNLHADGDIGIAVGAGSGATITVSDGGSITSDGNVYIGGGAETNTSLLISGEDALVSIGAIFEVAVASSPSGQSVGSVTVENGGTLRVGGLMRLGLDETTAVTLNLNEGGTLQIGGNDTISSLSELTEYNLSGGTIQVINSNLRTYVDFTTANTSTIDTNGLDAEFSGVLSGSGGLVKTGSGILTLTNTNTFTGGVAITEGTLALSALGTINNSTGIHLGTTGILDLTAKSSGFTFASGQSLTGSGSVNLAEGRTLTIAGTLAPGNSPGLVSIDGNLAFESTAITLLEIGGLERGVAYDAIDVTGDLVFDGTLTVTLINDFTPMFGDSFQLFEASSFGGTFAQLNLPDLDPTLRWNTDHLHDTGILSVVGAIPEPSTFAALAGLGALALATTRRRR